MSLPICILHNIRIVDDLPNLCPMKHKHLSTALLGMREEAHRRDRALLYRGEGEGGKTLHEMHDTCSKCAPVLVSDPHVRRLRKKSCLSS